MEYPTTTDLVKELTEFSCWVEKLRKPRRRPKRRKGARKPYVDALMTIRDAARRKRKLLITYTNMRGETKRYLIAPYSFRTKMVDKRARRLLYAYDHEDKTIKGFVTTRISEAVPTDRRFRAKWDVEL